MRYHEESRYSLYDIALVVQEEPVDNRGSSISVSQIYSIYQHFF